MVDEISVTTSVPATTVTFTGDSDAVQFPTALSSDTTGFEGTIATGADTITFNGAGNDGNTRVSYIADLPGDIPGTGDFVYTTTLAMSGMDDIGGWWEHGMRVTFADDSVADHLWGNYGDDGTWAYAGGDFKCITTIDASHICEDTDAVVDTGDIMLRLELSGTTLTASYSADGTSWTEAGTATLDAAVAAGWTLQTLTHGLDNATWASLSAVVDEISVTYTPVAADVKRPVITIIGDNPGEVVQGGTYVDEGATAEDNVDGDITANIATVSTLDVNTLGDYTVTYTVSDAAGNEDEEIRTVTVFADAPPVITLTGDANVELPRTAIYTELGATATDYVEGDIAVTIGGDTVDTDTIGTYTVTYDVSDSAGLAATQVTRTVVVVADQAAEITLDGLAGFELLVGGTYTEEGYAAIDDLDGDISANIVVGGDVVDSTTSGRYVITYTVTDSVGNTAVVSRTVKVVEELTPVGLVVSGLFEGSDDEVKFESADATKIGAITYEDDTISFVSLGQGPEPYYELYQFEAPVPGSVSSGTGDFEYVMTLAMSDLDYLANHYSQGMRVSFGENDVDIVWRQASAWPIDRTRKCITVYSYDHTADTLDNAIHTPGDGTTDPVYEACDIAGLTGDLSLKITSDAGVLTLSYTPDTVTRAVPTWTDVYTLDLATTAVLPTAAWELSVIGTNFGYDMDGGHAEDTLVDGVLHYAAPYGYINLYDGSPPIGNKVSLIAVSLPPGPVITLNGDATIALELGVDTYTELGATAEDDLFGELTDTNLWTIAGVVDTDTVGTYEVTYDVSNPNGLAASTVTRTINVSSRPVITLHGPETVRLIPGTRYWERDTFGITRGNPTDDSNLLIPETEDDCGQFATAVIGVGCFYDDYYDDGNGNWSDVTVTDAEDGDLTPRAWSYDVVVWTESTEGRAALPWDHPDALTMYDFTGWEGEYEIHYNAKDSSGLEAVEVVRTVIVAEPTDLDPIPEPEAASGCFIGAASPNSSTGMFFPLAGLVLVWLTGCSVRRKAGS